MTPSPARSGDAGRELDAEIAEKVMGWRRQFGAFSGTAWISSAVILLPYEPEKEANYTDAPATVVSPVLPHYSTDIAAAWLVVEKMDSDHGAALHLTAYRHENPPPNERHRAMFWSNRDSIRSHQTRYDTAPLAICRASLAALALGDRP